MMRITQQMMVGNMLKHLQRNTSLLDQTYQQLATGRKYQRASEAPIKVTNSMQFNASITNAEQYKRNAEQALNWLNFSESSITDANNIIQSARELAVYTANGTLEQADLDMVVEEVKELKVELINIANSKMDDRYLFAGQATDIAPYDSTGNYQGDYNTIQREVSPGVRIDINTNGEQVFSSAIEAVQNLHDNLIAGDNEAISTVTIGELDGAINDNLSTRAEIGAKINRLELTKSRLDDEIINVKKQLSEVEDVDLAETITELKMQESVYRSALGVGARIMQPTLLDFLR